MKQKTTLIDANIYFVSVIQLVENGNVQLAGLDSRPIMLGSALVVGN